MAPSLRRRRQRRTGQDKAALPIADDLLAEIFLRLPTPADLVRAAAVCPSFRRVATDRSFIRQFRKLHAPLLLGLVTCDGFHQVLPPHPSAPASQALALAADFSFSFLPSLGRWCVHDARDGRVLLRRKPENKKASVIFTEVVVCDPLHRRHLLLPPVPKDLQDLVVRQIDVLIGPSLAPPSEEEEVEETSFRVIYMARCKTQPVALIFSSNTGQWRGAASQSWSDLEPSTEPITAWGDFLYRSHYACGCFYWEMDCRGKLLVLHIRSVEFSIADPPPGAGEWRHLAIVEAGEDRPGMFALADGTSSDLYYSTIRRNSLWQAEKTISLGRGLHYIAGGTERYLILGRNRESLQLDIPDYQRFTLDIRTLQLERICEMKRRYIYELLYTNFPPSFLSLPTV